MAIWARLCANADAAAVTGLGVYVDTDWLDKRQGVAEALVSLSADAELEDDFELSRAIDALKDRMDKADRLRLECHFRAERAAEGDAGSAARGVC